MSWLAEYILLPLLKNQYTVAGRSSIAIIKSIRQLITDKMVGSEGKQIQVMQVMCFLFELCDKMYYLKLDCNL